MLEKEGRESKERRPWDQQPDEPDLWYERFEVYRALGPTVRSINRTYQIRVQEEEGLNGQAAGQAWAKNASRWKWHERARAWDEEERQRFRAQEEELRTDARLGRLQMIREMQQKVYTALGSAEIDRMDMKEARLSLPQLRLLFIALLAAERADFGETMPVAEDDEAARALNELIETQVKKAYGKAGVSEVPLQ